MMGATGLFFGLFEASVYAIVAAVLGRVGLGKPLPFGPFLVLGALSWMLGGWKAFELFFGGLAGGM